MRHAPGHEHEPGWNGKRLLQSGVLLLPCRPVSSAARRGRAVASSSQSPAALSRSHASGPDRHVSARSVERRIVCFSYAFNALRRLAWQRTGRGSRCRGPCRTRRCSRYSTCYTLTASSITHPTVIRCMRNVLYCSGTTCAQADSVKLWQGYAAPAPQQQVRAMVPGPYSQAPQMTASPLMTQMTSPPQMTQMSAAPQMTQLTAPQRTQLTAPQMTQMSAVPQMQYMMPATAAVAPAPAPPPVQVIAFPLLHFQLCGWIVCTPFRSE